MSAQEKSLIFLFCVQGSWGSANGAVIVGVTTMTDSGCANFSAEAVEKYCARWGISVQDSVSVRERMLLMLGCMLAKFCQTMRRNAFRFHLTRIRKLLRRSIVRVGIHDDMMFQGFDSCTS